MKREMTSLVLNVILFVEVSGELIYEHQPKSSDNKTIHKILH